MRHSWEAMTSVWAGHILLTPTQPVGSGRPQRKSNPGSLHQESRALHTELPLPPPPPPKTEPASRNKPARSGNKDFIGTVRSHSCRFLRAQSTTWRLDSTNSKQKQWSCLPLPLLFFSIQCCRQRVGGSLVHPRKKKNCARVKCRLSVRADLSY